MADILHDFPVRATVEDVFRAFSMPAGRDTWWTLKAEGCQCSTRSTASTSAGFDWRAASAESNRAGFS
jgi:uncharacterized protein YndB with AHSA1/START domain